MTPRRVLFGCAAFLFLCLTGSSFFAILHFMAGAVAASLFKRV